MRVDTLAKMEGALRPFLILQNPQKVVQLYSKGRVKALEMMAAEPSPEVYFPPAEIERTMWGLSFQGPIMNAAGMFKNLDNYDTMLGQGAGGYVGGTGTADRWEGNKKGKKLPNGNINDVVDYPFVPYPRSGCSSNALGLPNDGDNTNTKRAEEIASVRGCPYFQSVMGHPGFSVDQQKMEWLILSMHRFVDAGVDGIEQNDSCPNTGHGSPAVNEFAQRAKSVNEGFVQRRSRFVPIVLKASNDTSLEQIPFIMDTVLENGYDGINFGNTSVAYNAILPFIHPKERRLFVYFTDKFGGGVGGRALKEKSLALAAAAVDYLNKGRPSREFHVWRTGGIENAADLIESDRAGISMNQWFTGYFHQFAKHGHGLYAALHADYLRLSAAAKAR